MEIHIISDHAVSLGKRCGQGAPDLGVYETAIGLPVAPSFLAMLAQHLGEDSVGLGAWTGSPGHFLSNVF